MVTTHLRLRGGMVELSPVKPHDMEEGVPRQLPVKPQKGEMVLISLRDEFFEFFRFELPPAGPKELKPLVDHRCRQQATPGSLVGAKLAGVVKDTRGLPKERLIVCRLPRERISGLVSSLDLYKNRFLGIVPRSELIISSLNGMGVEIPGVEEAFCTIGILRTMLALFFFQGREFLFARHIALQEGTSSEEIAQRVVMEFVQTNLYMNQRYRLECSKVFVGAGELEKTSLLQTVSEGTGKEVVGLCSLAESHFSRFPTAGEFLLGGAAWLLREKPHERLLILPPEVKQFYRSQRVSTVALTMTGVLLVGSVLGGLGMSTRLHQLRKREWRLRNRVLEERGKVKAMRKEFPSLEQWKDLRKLGDVNPGSPPIQQVLAVLSSASIPEVVLDSCQVSKEKDGRLDVMIEGEVVSGVSYLDALKRGQEFSENLKREFGKAWPAFSVKEFRVEPQKARDREKEESKDPSKVYRMSLHAEFLLGEGE